jgi:hypothetical protein
MMRRIVLVLALTALLVAVALAGSALGQPVTEPGCGGLEQAATAQEEPAPQPPPLEEKEQQFSDRSQGEVHSVVPEVQSAHGCVK